jgi:hypothetical protein
MPIPGGDACVEVERLRLFRAGGRARNPIEEAGALGVFLPRPNPQGGVDMMKRIALLALSLMAVFAVLAASASAAPAPKATGGVGFSYGGLERNVSFAAIQTTDKCGAFWSVADMSQFTMNYLGLDYTHRTDLAQTGQAVTGDGGFPLTGTLLYHWNITSGSVVGNTLTLTMDYDLGAVGTMHMIGTIAPDGSITGNWTDNVGGARSGTFTAPAGSATAMVSYCGKGTFYYSDSNGSWYFGVVRAVDVSSATQTAWFATQILVSSSDLGFENLATNYLFTKVVDNGEPGINVDQLGVENLMSPVDAVNDVINHADTSLGDVTINEGNLQVH